MDIKTLCLGVRTPGGSTLFAATRCESLDSSLTRPYHHANVSWVRPQN